MALLACAVAIYLIVSEIAGQNFKGILLSIGILVAKIGFDFNYVPFPLVCVIISGILPYSFSHLKDI